MGQVLDSLGQHLSNPGRCALRRSYKKTMMPESRLKGICQSRLRKINMSTSLILHTRHSCTRTVRSLSRSRNSRLAAADGEAKGMGRSKKFQIGDILVCILCLSLCVAASL